MPSARFSYNTSPHWALSIEEYADFGHVSELESVGNQAHQLFAVVDYVGWLEVQFGAGFGLTDASDKFQLKMILAKDLNRPRSPRH